MLNVRRHVWFAALAAAAFTASACSDSPSGPRDDTRRMAETFDAIADSLDNVGMDDYARPYAYVADLIRAAGGATAITLSVNGKPEAYYAVGAQIEMTFWYCGGTGGGGGGGVDTLAKPSFRHAMHSGMTDTSHMGDSVLVDPYCEPIPHSQNMFFAWEPDSAWRLVRIMSDTGYAEVRSSWNDSVAVGLTGPIDDTKLQASSSVVGDTGSGGGGGDSGWVEPIYAPMLWAELMDSEGRFWWANHGSQTNRLLTEGADCTTEMRDTTRFDLWAPMTCTRAVFSYQHDLRFDPPPEWVMSPVAGGTDTVTYVMQPQSIVGVVMRFDSSGWYPPDTVIVDTVIVDTIPPDTIPPTNDTLRVLVYGFGDSTNTTSDTTNLRLIVMNQSRDTVTISFASTQEYDFVVYDSATHTKVWQWSDGKGFGEMITHLRLAPGESKVYGAKWPHGSRTGVYLVEGRLTSTNFPRKAYGSIFLY